jgi:hypothetical protein
LKDSPITGLDFLKSLPDKYQEAKVQAPLPGVLVSTSQLFDPEVRLAQNLVQRYVANSLQSLAEFDSPGYLDDEIVAAGKSTAEPVTPSVLFNDKYQGSKLEQLGTITVFLDLLLHRRHAHGERGAQAQKEYLRDSLPRAFEKKDHEVATHLMVEDAQALNVTVLECLSDLGYKGRTNGPHATRQEGEHAFFRSKWWAENGITVDGLTRRLARYSFPLLRDDNRERTIESLHEARTLAMMLRPPEPSDVREFMDDVRFAEVYGRWRHASVIADRMIATYDRLAQKPVVSHVPLEEFMLDATGTRPNLVSKTGIKVQASETLVLNAVAAACEYVKAKAPGLPIIVDVEQAHKDDFEYGEGMDLLKQFERAKTGNCIKIMLTPYPIDFSDLPLGQKDGDWAVLMANLTRAMRKNVAWRVTKENGMPTLCLYLIGDYQQPKAEVTESAEPAERKTPDYMMVSATDKQRRCGVFENVGPSNDTTLIVPEGAQGRVSSDTATGVLFPYMDGDELKWVLSLTRNNHDMAIAHARQFLKRKKLIGDEKREWTIDKPPTIAQTKDLLQGLSQLRGAKVEGVEGKADDSVWAVRLSGEKVMFISHEPERGRVLVSDTMGRNEYLAHLHEGESLRAGGTVIPLDAQESKGALVLTENYMTQRRSAIRLSVASDFGYKECLVEMDPNDPQAPLVRDHLALVKGFEVVLDQKKFKQREV